MNSFNNCIVAALDKFDARINQPIKWWSYALFPLLAFAVIEFYWFGGRLQINNFLGDYWLEQDNAWRISQGQVPYIDFDTPLGPLYYVLLRIAFFWAHGGPTAPAIVNAFPMGLTAPLILWIARERVGASLGFILVLVFSLIAISPRNLDGNLGDSSFVAPYNTLCLLLIMAPLMVGLFSRQAADKKREIFEGIIAGLFVGAMFLIKANNGILGLGFLTVGLIAHRKNRYSLIIALTVSAISSLTAWVVIPGMDKYIVSLHSAVQASGLGDRSLIKTLHSFTEDSFVLFSGYFAIWILEKRRQHTGDWKSFLCGFVLYIASLMVMINDLEIYPVLLMPLFLIVWSTLKQDEPPIGDSGSWVIIKNIVLLLPFFAMSGWNIGNDTGAFAGAIVRAFMAKNIEIKGNAPYLNRIKFSDGEASGVLYIKGINDGISLLQSLGLSHKIIFSADFSNPFPYLLQAPSMQGGMGWIDTSRTLSAKNHPTYDRMIGNTQIVMINKLSYNTENQKEFYWIYGKDICKNFKLIKETQTWQVYGLGQGECKLEYK